MEPLLFRLQPAFTRPPEEEEEKEPGTGTAAMAGMEEGAGALEGLGAAMAAALMPFRHDNADLGFYDEREKKERPVHINFWQPFPDRIMLRSKSGCPVPKPLGRMAQLGSEALVGS